MVTLQSSLKLYFPILRQSSKKCLCLPTFIQSFYPLPDEAGCRGYCRQLVRISFLEQNSETHGFLLHGSHWPGKPGIWPKKIPCKEKSWNLKIRAFSWKNHGILFHLSTFFFTIRIYFANFFLCPLLACLLILIKKGGLLQFKFGIINVSINFYLWAR